MGEKGEKEKTRKRLLRKERVRSGEGVVLCILILCLPSAGSLFRLLLLRQPWNVSVPKNHIPTQEGFPTSERQREAGGGGGEKGAGERVRWPMLTIRQASQPERRESQRTWLIHRATLTARPWHRLLLLANNAIQQHTAIVKLEWESQYRLSTVKAPFFVCVFLFRFCSREIRNSDIDSFFFFVAE